MKKLKYKILIKGTKEQVWTTIIEKETYSKWAKAFSPNSQCEGEWKKGAEIKFFDPNMGGTSALIVEFTPYEKISAYHTATVTKCGVRETTGDMTEKWIGTKETYKLSDVEGKTQFVIDIQTHSDFEKMFNDSWPQALENIKNLVEL